MPGAGAVKRALNTPLPSSVAMRAARPAGLSWRAIRAAASGASAALACRDGAPAAPSSPNSHGGCVVNVASPPVPVPPSPTATMRKW